MFDQFGKFFTKILDNPNSFKIPIVDNSYKCPIEGCGKNFRRENLAQMHVKHYHPEYTKFLDSTPNVADLAYARTVGESLDRSPGPEKPTRVTPRQLQKPALVKSSASKTSQVAEEPKPAPPRKDSEIIKLLTGSKSHEPKQEEPAQSVLPSGLPASAYPELKLKDLLSKSEGKYLI